MKRIATRVGLAVTAAALVSGMGVGAAEAATAATVPAAPGTVHPMTKHTGHTTCFSWSWDDKGTASVTVYYHNRCKHSRGIRITTRNGVSGVHYTVCKWVKGHKSGKAKVIQANPTVSSIKEVSKC